ncbi:50S ribosomal protein L11 methyltransferase [Levilactobacillus bambusae]|uniref:Ribosomal protein L11 methyltransferase n=1 Tax=Levilactobacillus bambusae TaxID=2024736 RepID=A0A2V1N0F0_9LACO|nr:50S ribosomal protein L11 methyltransferase [Levilactobacillus bambusae]PWG00751.1 50S ribosomal protein L11 methyltransferase [Levilactobacillus bambusae]
MKWTELTVKTSSEAVEAVANLLMEAGATGVQIDDSADYSKLKPGRYGEHGEIVNPSELQHVGSGATVSAYYPADVNMAELAPTLSEKITGLKQFGLNPGEVTVTTNEVADEDWATTWERYYHPVRVTRYITIVPEWEDYVASDQREIVIRLNPGQAFGTGTHETTQLCLIALEMVVRGHERMYDVGTGSGVLSIAAKLLGVDQITAFDVDEVAVASAKQNLALNPVAAEIPVLANDLLSGITAPVDIVMGNLLADIVIPLVPQAWAVLEPGGLLITSGIIDDKLDGVLAATKNQGFIVDSVLTMNEWRAVIAHKPTEDD